MTGDAPNYKHTLSITRTDFPQKAKLATREPERLEHWKKIGLVGLVEAKGEGNPKYVLHDGPPYANGDIHLGHAMNKTLKDIVHFYNTRDKVEENWPPPEIKENVNTEELGDLGLTPDEEDLIVKFMKTLSDR